MFERAREIKEALLGKDHVGVAVVLNNLAALYQKQGSLDSFRCSLFCVPVRVCVK